MAEVQIKIGSSGSYEDGDVIETLNDRHISQMWVDFLTNIKHDVFTPEGLRRLGTIYELGLDLRCQYKFERISSTQVRRTDRISDTVVVYDWFPNAQGEYINVEEHVRYLLSRKKRHKVFGTLGAEVWYGGRTINTAATLDSVWSILESMSKHRKADYQLAPRGRQELKSHYVVSIDDFDDATESTYNTGEYDALGNLLTKSKYGVNWRQLHGMTPRKMEKIMDKRTRVDDRGAEQYQHAAIIRLKQPGGGP